MKNIFTRSKLNPILRPDGEWWKVYNPGAVVDRKGMVHIFPRVVKKEDDWHSRIAHAVSVDGERFEWDENLLLTRSSKDELRGLEDPRVTKIGGKYFMTFAVYDGKSVQLHTAVADNLDGPWQRQGPALPGFDFVENGGKMMQWKRGKPVERKISKRGTKWSKSGAMFPRKVDGKYYMVFGEYFMWLASSVDGVTFEKVGDPIIEPRKSTAYFDNTFVETGPSPILTDKGWLVLYHGIDEAFRYQIGFAVLDENDPTKIIYRSNEPIFGPKESYEVGDALIDVITGGLNAMSKLNDNELKGFYKKAREENIMPQVTFCPGAVIRDGKLQIYYGAGDTSICTAWASLDDILGMIP